MYRVSLFDWLKLDRPYKFMKLDSFEIKKLDMLLVLSKLDSLKNYTKFDSLKTFLKLDRS